ncbi:MAG: nicotinate (nicotinamide) nucleotide adenylyltransferase [Dysgonamonadaceae bacterium]
MNIGIFSGSFNPIHHGHLMIANYIAEFTTLDEIWFLVSPQNPLKKKTELADAHHRLQMVRNALSDFDRLKASDFELHLPLPSYTIDTLKALQKAYPEHTFSLVIGADNWTLFQEWKDYQEILRNYRIYVYKRLNYSILIPGQYQSRVVVPEAPVLEISSTFIRESISRGKDVRAFIPGENWKYIEENGLYR